MAVVDSSLPNSLSSCCVHGPGYATPLDAMSGPREEIIYVTAVYTGNVTSVCLYCSYIHTHICISF